MCGGGAVWRKRGGVGGGARKRRSSWGVGHSFCTGRQHSRSSTLNAGSSASSRRKRGGLWPCASRNWHEAVIDRTCSEWGNIQGGAAA